MGHKILRNAACTCVLELYEKELKINHYTFIHLFNFHSDVTPVSTRSNNTACSSSTWAFDVKHVRAKRRLMKKVHLHFVSLNKMKNEDDLVTVFLWKTGRSCCPLTAVEAHMHHLVHGIVELAVWHPLLCLASFAHFAACCKAALDP